MIIMERCIVEGCTTGLSNGTKRGQTITTRHNVFFKVPDDPDLLSKWCTALDQNVVPKDKVCELHFKQEDILKNVSTFTKVQGQKTITFKKRFSLKSDAVPWLDKDKKTSNQQETDIIWLEDDKHNSDSDESVIEFINEEEEKKHCDVVELDQDPISPNDTIVQDITQSPQSFKSDGDKQTEENPEDESESMKSVEQNLIEPKNDDDALEPQQTIDPQPKQQRMKEKVLSNYIKNGVVVKRVVQSLKSVNGNVGTKNVSPKRKLINTFTTQNKAPRLEVSSFEPYTSLDPVARFRKNRYPFSPSQKLYDLDELKVIVQHKCIRPQWCVKIEDRSVFFTYVDFDQSRVNCCLEIAENFEVNAYTADKVIAIYVATNGGVRCISEIIEIMKVLEKKRWCLGPGVPLISRPATCIGAMPVKTANDNCAACIKEKLNAQTHTRELANCRIKLEESRHKCDLIRKKHNYATTQYERLKAENKILEFQVDEAKRLAINDVLNRLPSLQRQIVRYFINASYTAKNTSRYCTAWINECLVMRAMSPALYEYMRQKDILPLPCPETLKKHKFKINLEKDPNASDTEESIDYVKLSESSELPKPLDVPEATQIVECSEISETIQMMPETGGIYDSAEMLRLLELAEATAMQGSIQLSESSILPDKTEEIESKAITELPEVQETIEIVGTRDMPDLTDLSESTEIILVPEILDSTVINQSTNVDGYTVMELIPDSIMTEDVAYEVTVSSETVEEYQY